MNRPRWLLIGSALLAMVGMTTTLIAFAVLFRIETSLVSGPFGEGSRTLIRLRTLNDFPWLFRMAWSLRALAMLAVGLHLAAWAQLLREERPFLTQATAYFLGIGMTLESLSWALGFRGLPELASWYWQTVPADQAIPFREFGIWSGIHGLLSVFLAGILMCGAGLLLACASLKSKVAPPALGLAGAPLFGLGACLGLASPVIPAPLHWGLSSLATLGGLVYTALLVWAWGWWYKEGGG